MGDQPACYPQGNLEYLACYSLFTVSVFLNVHAHLWLRECISYFRVLGAEFGKWAGNSRVQKADLDLPSSFISVPPGISF